MACKIGPDPAPRRAAVPQRAARKRPEVNRYIIICFRMFSGVVLATAVVLPTVVNARDEHWALFQLLMYSLLVGLIVYLTSRWD